MYSYSTYLIFVLRVSYSPIITVRLFRMVEYSSQHSICGINCQLIAGSCLTGLSNQTSNVADSCTLLLLCCTCTLSTVCDWLFSKYLKIELF